MTGYYKYGGIAFLAGLLLYKSWDRRQSNKATAVYFETDWLTPVEPVQYTRLTKQEIYDFSTAFLGMLKGVFAGPTAAKLARLNEMLAAPHHHEDQLWQDISMRLAATYHDYPVEYEALLEAIAIHSKNATQRQAAFRLATTLPYPSSRLQTVAHSLRSDLHKAQAG